jgi:hypothetical protein
MESKKQISPNLVTMATIIDCLLWGLIAKTSLLLYFLMVIQFLINKGDAVKDIGIID